MKTTAIIIGAGIGGLALAARLLNEGYGVTLVEKNECVGGKASAVVFDDYSFDGGATMVMMPEGYKAIFEEVGKNYQDYFTMKQLETNYKVCSPGKAPKLYSAELNQVIRQLEAESPKLSHGYLDFLADTYGKWLFLEKYFLDQGYSSRYDILKPRNARRVFKLHGLSSVEHYLKGYIKNDDFLAFLCFQAMYLGVSPYQGSNIFSLVPAMVQMYGLWSIKGGMNAYVQALEKLVLDLGGVILTKTEVEEIVMAGEQAIGVKTKDQVLLADLTICNGDYVSCLTHLMPKGLAQAEEFEPEDGVYSCGTFMVYLATDRLYPQLEVHNILINDQFKKNLTAPFRGKIPRKPSLYIYCPTRVDESRTPAGHELISITVRVPNLQTRPASWNEKQKTKYMKKIIALVAEYFGMEDLENHLLLAQCTTPKDMQERYHCYEGASFGLSPSRKQSGILRPSVKCKHINRLYFVGDSIQPGAGVSLVLKSAKIAAEEIKQSAFLQTDD